MILFKQEKGMQYGVSYCINDNEWQQLYLNVERAYVLFLYPKVLPKQNLSRRNTIEFLMKFLRCTKTKEMN